MRYCFVTPSYRGDFERCRILCDSTTRFLGNDITHYVVVDRRDETLFQPLASPVVTILTVESVLPWWIFRMPGVKGWWASLKTRPIRNWILQQLVKITIARELSEDVINFVDSDVTFVRPFSPDPFVRDDRVRLARVSMSPTEEHADWIKAAGEILKLPETPATDRNYVGSLITWRRQNVLKMHDHIEKVNGRDWIPVLSKHWQFSEYMLYGVFVEDLLGVEHSGHFVTDAPVLHLSWGYDLTTEQGVAKFLGDVKSEHLGIMIHSKDDIPVKLYEEQVHALWERLSREEPIVSHSG